MTPRYVSALMGALLLLLAGCDEDGQVSKSPPNLADQVKVPSTVQSTRQALGEVVDTYPSDQERMVLVLTNLARSAPANECGDWTMEQMGNAPKYPLVHTHVGNMAARYTSTHMADLGCFQHESCCVLGDVMGNVECVSPGNCDTDTCGKQCTGGSPISERYSLLGMNSWSGENIARGQPSAKDVWCDWMNSDGHRMNIYSGHTELGVGMVATAGGCGRYWTQAFGSGNVTIPRIPAASAIYAPPNPATTLNVYFAANYWDPSGKPPKRAAVVVNGHCFDMSQAWGVDGNATFETRFALPDEIPPGCHPYYFLFIDDAANRHVYPSDGSLHLALGAGETCPDAYTMGQLPADCETGVQTCAEGDSRSCYTGPDGTENVGVCHGGVQTCKNGFWSACSQQKLPGPEVCDGLDNNCDGTVDEGNPGGGVSCTVPGERGECQAGERQCLGGAMVCVSTYAPQLEDCDGLDNDCDGVVDDGWGSLSCGAGECYRVIPACKDGQSQTCEPGTPETEVADSRDNDCDGIVDNGIDCRKSLPDGGMTSGFARVCYSFPSTLPDGGIIPPQPPCQRGVQVCGATGEWGPCTGEVGPEPELCDGVDNDCDGVTDNNDLLGWQRCGTGWCTQFERSCRLGKPYACTPRDPVAESCDGTDNDCDAEIDEGCTCRNDLKFVCYSGPTASLDAGVCQTGLNTCVGGEWAGCAGEVVPGTEYCNDLDDDCDGTTDEQCIPPPVMDGGVDAGTSQNGGDGGTDGPGPDGGPGSGGDGGGGCGCQSGPGSSPVFFLLLAFGAIVLRRGPSGQAERRREAP